MSDEQKNIFSNNLKYYMSINDVSQIEVANKIGVSPQTFNTWIQGIALPRMGKVQMLADYFGIRKSDLIEERQNVTKQKSKGVVIPVLGHVAAGIPIEMIEDIIDTEEIPEDMAKHGEFFALKIKGDSMTPSINNSDVVIVRQQEDAENGDIVIATVNGNDAVCKRLKKYSDGLSLISLNPAYEPLYFNTSEIQGTPVKIIGKVVELRRKF
jgi:SOS-response transcriptional repressor, lexA|nr:MAG TPA: Repressor protein CI [Caudoviricetes sp.]